MFTKQSTSLTQGAKSVNPEKINSLKISVIGDSLCEYTERGPSWVQMLGEYINIRGPEDGAAAISAAVGGSTFETALTNQIGNTLDLSQPDIVKESRPDLIFICLGFNDVFNTSFNAQKVITDADALFNRVRADNPLAHIVYVEELAYDRTNITGAVYPGGVPIGLKNKNLLPFLHEGQSLYGLNNVYDTSSDFLNATVSEDKHQRVQTWIDVTTHIKSQSYIDSSMVFDMFFLSRCGMHTDLLHLDRYGYKMFALDARKHIVDTQTIIGGELGQSDNLVRFNPVKSTSDTVNPNLLRGTDGLRSAFSISGVGVDATYLYIEDFVQIGFVNHDSYDLPTRQFIWPLQNRNLRANMQGRLGYRNSLFEFEAQALVPSSTVYIQYDDLPGQASTQPVLQNCTFKVQERFNEYFPSGDFTPGDHLVGFGWGYQNGRIEFYRKSLEIVNSGDDPDSGGGGSSVPDKILTRRNATLNINPGGGVQVVDMDTVVTDTSGGSLLLSGGSVIVSASATYTEYKVSMGLRYVNGANSGAGAIQASINGQLPSVSTTPIIGGDTSLTNGNAAWVTAEGPWIPVSGGGDQIRIWVTGTDGGTYNGGWEGWLEVEAR